MDLLDVFIIAAAIGYAFGGYRNGAVVGVFSLAGFVGGAIAGAQLGRPLARSLAHGQAQVVVALVVVLVTALVGQLALVYLARKVRSRIVWRSAQAADSAIGSVLGVVSVLLVAWMVAVPLASSPYPNLASEARHSAIVARVNTAVPGDVRSIYSSLQQFIDRSGFPQVLNALQPTRNVPVDPPDPALVASAAVKADEPSVLKIYGRAPQCSRQIEGSGFVYAPGKMLTNAHVVAGTNQVQVQVSDSQTLTAHVVVYDPERDVAVLSVPGLKAPALTLASATAASGSDAIVLGYPEDGGFTPRAARIRDQEPISGHDIYGNGNITRQIYSIRGVVQSGNSGGPLIDTSGAVLGIVFATALDASETGFVLTNGEIKPDADAGLAATDSVPTGACD